MLKGEKILITGAGGFVGSYFLERLKDENEVTAIIRKNPEEYWRLGLFEKNYAWRNGDISNSDSVSKIFSETKPDIVLHMASYGTYPSMHRNMGEIISTNINGAINIAEAALASSRTCIMTGSSSEYGNAPSPMKEDGPALPTIVYGASKLFATHYSAVRARETGKKLYTVRPFSVYGPYEEPFRLIPTICSASIMGTKLNLSSPNSVRDFIFVEDYFSAVMKIIEKSDSFKPGEAINIGSGAETSIGQIAEIAEKMVAGKKLDITWGASSKQPELSHWYADISKLKRIGFEPKHDLEHGLKKTMEWISNNIKHYGG